MKSELEDRHENIVRRSQRMPAGTGQDNCMRDLGNRTIPDSFYLRDFATEITKSIKQQRKFTSRETERGTDDGTLAPPSQTLRDASRKELHTWKLSSPTTRL
jgi:hypothetical protein